jgi:glycosyltransferase involved in cell wall biosynthesis
MTSSSFPRVLHVPFTFYPEPVGGTEVYVEALARRLYGHGFDSLIAVPGEQEAGLEHEGLRVRRYGPLSGISDLRDLYGEGDPAAAAGFGRLLEAERPAVVHLHAQTRGVSLRVLREAKRRGIPVVYTYHTPTATCQRGTLLRDGGFSHAYPASQKN